MTAESASSPAQFGGRVAAAKAIAAALAGRQFVSESLRSLRGAGWIRGREAGLAMEIAQGALRHCMTIDQVLGRVARYDRSKTAPRLRAILYAGAYQIIWMDRVPTYAAVDESVELARRLVGGRTPGMVNALLRRLVSAIEARRSVWNALDATQVRVDWEQACQFATPVLPVPDDDPAAHLAAATGETPTRFAELVERYGQERAAEVGWASQAVPVTVAQGNPLRATRAQLADALQTEFEDFVEVVGDRAYLAARASVFDTDAFRCGWFYVQDDTARAAAEALAAQPGQRVLDLCAAPGGKSYALAFAMQDQGKIVACDVDEQRLALVTSGAARLGVTCIETRCVPAEVSADDPGWWAGATDANAQPSGGGAAAPPCFDAALVDVPCSNSGVIARRPEARLGLTKEKLASLVTLQATLLRRAAAIVRPGGRLVYSTCSIEPAENEQVVAAFTEAASDWRLLREQTSLPHWGPRLSDWRDGGYFAVLERSA